MRRRVFASAVACVALALSAHAQSPRTFVSSAGNDANPCSRVAPCRNFAAAVAAVAAGGEVVVLDSAGYGPFAIAQALSVISPSGVYAGVSVASGTGIAVAVGDFDTVTLRGLTITGVGGTTGIAATAGGAVHIEGCTVSGFRFSGNTGVSSTLTGVVTIDDSIIRDGNVGADLGSASGTTKYSVNRSRFEKNNIAVRVTDSAGGTARATLSDSVMSLSNDGLVIEAGASAAVGRSSISDNATAAVVTGALAELYVGDTVVAHNTTGLVAVSGGTFAISASLIVSNGTALSKDGSSSFFSFGNNAFRGNTNDANSAITVVPLQ